MKHLDITLDLETCSLSTNAAVLQLAAVAWNRYAEDSNEVFVTDIPTFDAKVDLRSCLMDGFDFDRDTCKWWADRPSKLRAEMMSGDCYPLEEVFRNFADWLTDAKQIAGADSLALWAQGADFDLAILRTVCRKYGIRLPLSYHDFRCARTFIIEVGANRVLQEPLEGLKDHSKVYDCLPPCPLDDDAHNALYDAQRTSYNLWNVLSLIIKKE